MVVALSTAASACSTRPVQDPGAAEAARSAVARIVDETAVRVAVSKVGVKVCRATSVGISERDWIRGSVVEVTPEKIRVRVDDPGRFPHMFDGIKVVRGALVWDTPQNWKPCV